MTPCRHIVTYIFVTAVLLLVWGFDHYGELSDHPDCAPSNCGNSTIRYPFGNCGYAPTECLDNQTLHITVHGSHSGYYDPAVVFYGRVIGNITGSSYYTRTLQIAQTIGDSSVTGYGSLFGYGSVFSLSQGYMEGTILNCTQRNQYIDKNLTRLNWEDMDGQSFFYNGSSYDLCTPEDGFCNNCTWYSVVVPTDKNYNISRDKNLEHFNHKGFQITWSIPDSCLSCNATGGRCYRHGQHDYCICHRGVYHSNCSEGEDLHNLFYRPHASYVSFS